MSEKNTAYFKVVWAIARKDMAAEWRSRQLFSAMLVFSLLVILIFNFALDLIPGLQQELAAGVLWVTFTFTATLGLNRSLAMELEGGCLDALLLAPVERSAIYFGKLTGNLAILLLLEMMVLPLFSILYNINVLQPGLLLVLLLGSLGYVAAGTMLASMALQSRSRDVMLPLLLFPVVLPLIISAVRASAYFLQGQGMEAIWPHLDLLIVCDVIYLALCIMTFDYVVEE